MYRCGRPGVSGAWTKTCSEHGRPAANVRKKKLLGENASENLHFPLFYGIIKEKWESFQKEETKMFEMSIDKHDLEEIQEFLRESNLVQIMNEFGLEVQQMAFIFNSIYEGIDKAKSVLEGETDE